MDYQQAIGKLSDSSHIGFKFVAVRFTVSWRLSTYSLTALGKPSQSCHTLHYISMIESFLISYYISPHVTFIPSIRLSLFDSIHNSLIIAFSSSPLILSYKLMK